jgi:hypothetical protein
MGAKRRKKKRGRTKVGIFVSYARANNDLATDFLKRFRQQVDPSKNYKYTFWHDGHILVGEKWDGRIQEAIEDCDLGLLLISPAFLGSQYITRRELPRFVGKRGKAVIPVVLQPVDMKRHDLKGLRERQLFRLEKGVTSSRAYGDCYNAAKRDSFAYELFGHVERKLDRLFQAGSRKGK